MEPSNTPAGGQPANLRAGTPAIFNATAEAERLRKTIALAEEAIREAADHRSERHAPGETIEQTAARWNEAAEIEAAALACRKAARRAIRRLGIPRIGSPKQVAQSIETARAAALNLKHAIDLAQESAQRRRVDIAAHKKGGAK